MATNVNGSDMQVWVWSVTSETLPVHNIDTGEDFSTIQEAIDDPDTLDGNTITVDPRTYTENVDVNKRLTIQSENGYDNCIVQAANPNDHVIEVTADHVNISAFTIKDASSSSYGIYLNSVNLCNITNNYISNNYRGINLDNSSKNHITKNICTFNTHSGIAAWWDSNYNNITDNTGLNNGLGVELVWNSNYNNRLVAK